MSTLFALWVVFQLLVIILGYSVINDSKGDNVKLLTKSFLFKESHKKQFHSLALNKETKPA